MSHAPEPDADALSAQIDQLWEAARARLVAGRREEAMESLRLRRLLMSRAELLAAESRFREATAFQSQVESDLAAMEAELSGPLRNG